ncbi:MAG TPA: STAS domain-containing protein, partial [Limnochordia bacterium]|nr:STAS domain-containing protein [Limnochordia bacterium]
GINIRSGGRNRLSTLVAGLFLLALIAVMSPVLKSIPMATLVGVMVSVAVGTFDWGSLRELAKMPRPDAVVMVVTVIVVVATKNLAIGVLAGVVLSALAFGWKIAQIRTTAQLDAAGEKVYTLHGQLFFGTMSHFVDQFDPAGDPQRVAIDFRHSHVWDHSAIAAIEKVVGQYERQGKTVRLVGLNAESEGLIAKVGRAALLGESKAAV